VAVAAIDEILGLWCVLPDHRPLTAVGLITPYAGLLAVQQLGQHRAVGDIGRRGHGRVDQLAPAIDADMRPVGGYFRLMATDIGAGEVQVNVTLTPGETIAKTGAGGRNTLLWDLSGTPTLTDFTDVSPNVPIVLTSTTAGSIMADGTGTWQYAINCPTCGNGTSSPVLDSPITFDISAAGLSTASFVQNGNGLFFAADIMGANGNTGVVGAPTAVPVPAPAIGHGLLVLLAIGGVLLGGKLSENLKKRRSLAG
jgi:hypothetical protein